MPSSSPISWIGSADRPLVRTSRRRARGRDAWRAAASLRPGRPAGTPRRCSRPTCTLPACTGTSSAAYATRVRRARPSRHDPMTCTRRSPNTPTDARTSSTSSRRRRRRRPPPGSCAPGNERRCPASRATSRSQDRRAPRSQASVHVRPSGELDTTMSSRAHDGSKRQSDQAIWIVPSSPIPADGNPGSRTGSSRGDRRTLEIVDEPPHERPPSNDANSAIAGWKGFWVLR